MLALRYETAIRRALCLVFILTLVFGSIYSPMYYSTALAGESLTNNKYQSDNFMKPGKGFYRIYPASDGVKKEANGERKDQDVGGMFSITGRDLGLEENSGQSAFDCFISWLLQADTYYFVAEDNVNCSSQDTDGLPGDVDHLTPFFNVPSFQKSIQNQASALLDIGGYHNRKRLDYATVDSDEWTTTAKKYGWTLPNVTYVGENPIITYDVGEAGKVVTNDPLQVIKFGVQVVENVHMDLVYGSAIRFITGNPDFHMPTLFETKFEEPWQNVLSVVGSLEYANDDYVDETTSKLDRIVVWLYTNSQDPELHKIHSVLIGSDDDALLQFFKDLFGQGLDGDGTKFFTSWVKYTVDDINNHRDRDWTDDEIAALSVDAMDNLTKPDTSSGIYRFKEEMIRQFGTQVNEIIEILGSDKKSLEMGFPIGGSYLRYMPYNYEEMSPDSQAALGDVTDPRFEMWGTTNLIEGNIGSLSKDFFGVMSGLVLSLISGTTSLANLINGMCSFQFIDTNVNVDPSTGDQKINFDITALWRGNIGLLFLYIVGAALIFLLVRYIIDIARGEVGLSQTLGKALTLVCSLGLVLALVAAPDMTGGFIKDLFSRCTNLGTSLYSNTLIKGWDELYADSASQEDKSELRYWALSYNAWAIYNTNHPGLGDESSKFEINHDDNVYIHLDESPAKLSNDETSNLWPIVLMQYQFDDDNGMYRAIDHYMAPSFYVEQGDLGYPVVKAADNPYYNGFVQSTIPYQYCIVALAVLFLAIVKFAFFVEFLMEVYLFLVKLISSLFDRGGLKQAVKKLFAPMLKVAIMDLISSIVILLTLQMSTSAQSTDITLNVIAIVLIFGVVMYVRQMLKEPDWFFTPVIFKTAASASKRIVNAGFAYATGMDVDIADPETRQQILDSSNPMRKAASAIKNKYKASQETGADKRKKQAQDAAADSTDTSSSTGYSEPPEDMSPDNTPASDIGDAEVDGGSKHTGFRESSSAPKGVDGSLSNIKPHH